MTNIELQAADALKRLGRNSLTKREEIASRMMAALISDSNYRQQLCKYHEDYTQVAAREAVVYADALINELNK